jgi:hypothetical protein
MIFLFNAAASRMTYGSPSLREGSATISAPAVRMSTSARGNGPR